MLMRMQIDLLEIRGKNGAVDTLREFIRKEFQRSVNDTLSLIQFLFIMIAKKFPT